MHFFGCAWGLSVADYVERRQELKCFVGRQERKGQDKSWCVVLFFRKLLGLMLAMQ